MDSMHRKSSKTGGEYCAFKKGGSAPKWDDRKGRKLKKLTGGHRSVTGNSSGKTESSY